MKRTRPHVYGGKQEFFNVFLYVMHCPWCKGESVGAVGHWFRLVQDAMYHAAYCGMKPASHNTAAP